MNIQVVNDGQFFLKSLLCSTSDTRNIVSCGGGKLYLKSIWGHKSVEIKYMKVCKRHTLTKNMLSLSCTVIAMFTCISSNWENTNGSK